MVGLHPVPPVVGQGHAAHTDYLVARSSSPCRANLEACGEDDAVDFVLDAVGNNPALGDPLDALSVAGVDQLDVGAVEGRQVFVVEGRAFAELTVPGLQR